jgi:F0F1-type ATP synthase assembly protein I
MTEEKLSTGESAQAWTIGALAGILLGCIIGFIGGLILGTAGFIIGFILGFLMGIVGGFQKVQDSKRKKSVDEALIKINEEKN